MTKDAQSRTSDAKAQKALATRKRREGPKGRRTKRLIKNTIHAMLAHHPVQEIKISDICAETGMTVGGFYFHFQSKEEAIGEVALDSINKYYSRILAFPVTDNFLLDSYEIAARFIWRDDHPRVLQAVFATLRQEEKVYLRFRELRNTLRKKTIARLRKERRSAKLPVKGVEITSDFLIAGLEQIYEMLIYRDFADLVSLTEDPVAFTLEIAKIWYRAALARDPDPRLVGEVLEKDVPVGPVHARFFVYATSV